MSNSINVLGYENKEKHQICILSKKSEENHADLSLLGDVGKRPYVLTLCNKTFLSLLFTSFQYRRNIKTSC